MDNSTSSITELVRAATRGDQSAYAALVLLFSPAMARSVCKVLSASHHWRRRGRPDDVSDLLQDVRLRLLEVGPRFLEGWNPSLSLPIEAAFKTIAQRAARSYLRSGRRSAWAEQPRAPDELSSAAGCVRIEERLFARARLREALSRFGPSRTPDILLALHLDGLSLDQICERLSVSRDAVYCATQRFRASVRAFGSQ